jgi:hypothetical protein
MHMTRRAMWVAGALVAAVAGGRAQAQTVSLAAALSGDQEVRPGLPPVVTSASGFGTLTYNQGLGTIVVNLRVQGLTGTTVGVGPGGGPGHVHFGLPGMNGGIVIPVTSAPIGATSFDVTQSYTFASLLGFGVAAADVATLTTQLNGLVGASVGTPAGLYFNVHTTTYPGGEIRGNLAVVPEPSTYVLMAGGLTLLGGVAARRRRTA